MAKSPLLDNAESIGEFEGWRSILPCCLPFRKAGGLQILRCQGIAVANYSSAWRDHTSDFISFGVRLDSEALRLLQCWGKVIQAADIASDLVGACDAPVTAALEIAKQNNGKWYVGSVVERVSYRATCPVIVITDPGIIPN
jgi:hypothetical protein